MTEPLWYPLWDAGFVTGHGSRSVKESVALADADLDALTALLEVRHLAGDPRPVAELEAKVRELAARRRERVLRALADAAEMRRLRPGPVAEMLEPDLKEGAGGLRDVQSFGWAGWALGAPGGTAALARAGLPRRRRSRARRRPGTRSSSTCASRSSASRPATPTASRCRSRTRSRRCSGSPMPTRSCATSRRRRARSPGSPATCGAACATGSRVPPAAAGTACVRLPKA